MQMLEFNINDTVKVKLTEHGHDLLCKQHYALWEDVEHNKRPVYNPPKEDEEGWSTWQLWVLMNAFGAHLYNGASPLPFNPAIKIVLPK